MKILASVIAAFLLVAVPASAREFNGVTIPDTSKIDGQEVTLKGVGLRKKWFFDVYVIGFYMADPAGDPLGDQARQVRLVLMRDLGADKISEAIMDGFEKNSKAQMPTLKDRLDKLMKAVPAVKKGQELVLSYSPGKGTVMTSGGKTLVQLEGKDFADALFKVWLGDNPADADLKQRLLGKKK